MIRTLDPRSIDSYREFLAIKALPVQSFRGATATFPDEYASRLGVELPHSRKMAKFHPSKFCFDYQAELASIAFKKRKFALFMDCGLGKTVVYFEWLRHVMQQIGETKGALWVCPLMVIDQTLQEERNFYGKNRLEFVPAKDLTKWTHSCRGRVGITNFESLSPDVSRGEIGAMVVDESSIMKSHYGTYGQEIIRIGRGLDWKLCGTGTPAPNDRIEFANHAVFLDQYPTVNAFLARYFVNRGQTQERWVLKPHALEPFYRSLSHWSIFLTNPSTYGWKDNCESIPPINVHIHDVELTACQQDMYQRETGTLFAGHGGGITHRGKMSKIAKGIGGTETLKYDFIRSLVDSWRGKSSTIIWCWYNAEQEQLERTFPDAASISGNTPYERRKDLIEEFKNGKRNVLISKPKVLGYGLNLQVATKQVFSSLIDSYEAYYQAVKRSNRYGSTEPLDVHIPVTDLERPMVENVLRKARRVQSDSEVQERIFKLASDGKMCDAVTEDISDVLGDY